LPDRLTDKLSSLEQETRRYASGVPSHGARSRERSIRVNSVRSGESDEQRLSQLGCSDKPLPDEYATRTVIPILYLYFPTLCQLTSQPFPVDFLRFSRYLFSSAFALVLSSSTCCHYTPFTTYCRADREIVVGLLRTFSEISRLRSPSTTSTPDFRISR